MTTCLGKSVHLVNCTCRSWEVVKFCVCPSFPYGIEGGIWDVIVLIPDHCLSVYFKIDHQESLMFAFEQGDALLLIRG